MIKDAGQGGFRSQLSPVGRETVQDRVYSELRRALIGGVFESGQVLTVRGLADALLTSTMPVREALGRLVVEKALEALPNRSVRIPPITIERLDELLSVRILIEGKAAELATARMSRSEIEQLEHILSDWEALRASKGELDVDREVRVNQSFHFAIYEACGSLTLLPIIESLWLQSGPCTRFAIQALSRLEEVDTDLFHRRIVESLRAKDAGKVREMLVADMSRSFAFLRTKLESDSTRAESSWQIAPSSSKSLDPSSASRRKERQPGFRTN